ncbi:female sterile (2) ltoPP43 isoform X2 [Musca autumnalis]|uniref:female sterile (2) ltoPP43 isoform X2 n=1 Tax=Musca autumnalis TaxID=221902 RepID=UPI003CEFDDCD
MPAVIRVKRRIDEEPLSAFVLNSKRRRLENEEAVDGGNAATALTNKEELSTLLKFAGTINEQDDTATTQFARLSKDEAKELVLRKTRKPGNITEKSRQEMRRNLQEQRFRVVNCLRTTLDDNESNANEKSKEITIVDIEKQHTTNDNKTVETQKSAAGVLSANLAEEAASTSAAAAVTNAISPSLAMPSDSDTGYVYDLYIPDNEQHADYVDLLDENYLRLQYPFNYYNEVYEYSSNNNDNGNYFYW